MLPVTLRNGRARVLINTQVVVYIWALAGLVLLPGGARGAEVSRHIVATSMEYGGMENTGKVDAFHSDTQQPHQTLALSPDLPTIMESAKLNETMNESANEIEHQPARNIFVGHSDLDAKKSTTNVALQSEFNGVIRRIRRVARGGKKGGGHKGGGSGGTRGNGGTVETGGGEKKKRKGGLSNDGIEQTGRDIKEYIAVPMYDAYQRQNYQAIQNGLPFGGTG